MPGREEGSRGDAAEGGWTWRVRSPIRRLGSRDAAALGPASDVRALSDERRDLSAAAAAATTDGGRTPSTILIISSNTATTFQLYLALQSTYEHFHCLRMSATISFSFSLCASPRLLVNGCELLYEQKTNDRH